MPRAFDTTHRNSRLRSEKGRPKEADSRNADLQQLLFELALALLPRGVTPKCFSKLAREAFIRAAADHARMRNGKVNHSKIAAITGLPRKEIRQILSRPSPASLELDAATSMPSERVVRGWLSDKRFLTRRGRPKILAIGGDAISFDRLVKEYGGDISPRAVLEELMRSRKVARNGRRVELHASKRPNPRNVLGPLARVIPTLVDGLRVASHQQASTIGSALYRLRLNAATEGELALIRQRSSSAVQSLLHGLKESLEHEFTVPIRKGSSRHALTLTVLLVNTDTNVP